MNTTVQSIELMVLFQELARKTAKGFVSWTKFKNSKRLQETFDGIVFYDRNENHNIIKSTFMKDTYLSFTTYKKLHGYIFNVVGINEYGSDNDDDITYHIEAVNAAEKSCIIIKDGEVSLGEYTEPDEKATVQNAAPAESAKPTKSPKTNYTPKTYATKENVENKTVLTEKQKERRASNKVAFKEIYQDLFTKYKATMPVQQARQLAYEETPTVFKQRQNQKKWGH